MPSVPVGRGQKHDNVALTAVLRVLQRRETPRAG
ncbi:hypothetical protein M2280_001982 [Prescottella agglutinans]|uniref:Transposase n=1 Tax=Prescottella agglutinans TaxID=1644129 RepID=A0ABT6MA11_9NOCA|nr:hypothetical protein [Prescottella agglutinans]